MFNIKSLNNLNSLNNTYKSLFIFLISLFVSFLLGMLNRSPQSITMTTFDKTEAFVNIIKNNTICFLWILSGILLSKYIVYIFLTLNGLMLGSLISRFANISYMMLILPHGVTEFFAFIMLSGITLNILKRKKFIKKDVSMILFSYVILFLSAIIESTLTPYLVSNFI